MYEMEKENYLLIEDIYLAHKIFSSPVKITKMLILTRPDWPDVLYKERHHASAMGFGPF